MPLDEPLHDVSLRRRGRREAVALIVGARRVFEPLVRRQVDAHLEAGGGGDVALLLDLLPRGVEALRADEAEDVALAAVLAHEGRGEAEAAPRLQLGGQLEDGGGQEVHLVVDDEAPVERVEQRQVRVLALPLRGQNLIRRDRDGLDLFDLPRVLADLVGGEGGAAQQLVAPLARRHRVRHEDERGRCGGRHRACADERLARATGQHDDTGAADEELVDRLLLVGAQAPVGGVEVDGVRGARGVAREVVGRPADLHELLLDLTARPRLQAVRVLVDAPLEQGSDALVRRDLGEHGAVGRAQHKPLVVALDNKPAVAAHRLGDVDRHRRGHRKLGVLLEHGEHLVGVVAGGPRVPEAEARDAIGVHVFGRALEFGEDRQGVSGVVGVRVRDLEKHGSVALNDERAVRIHNGSV